MRRLVSGALCAAYLAVHFPLPQASLNSTTSALLSRPSWTDLGNILDALDVASLSVPVYGNVMFLSPRRLDCSASFRAESLDNKDTLQLCEESTSAITSRMIDFCAHRECGSLSSADLFITITRAVYAELAYSSDGSAPMSVPKHVRGPDYDNTGEMIVEQVVPQLGAAAVVDVSVGDSDKEVHRFNIGWGFSEERYLSSHVLLNPRSQPAAQSVSVDASGEASTPHQPTPAAWARALRVTSANVWNSNPPRWLFRHGPDRLRQYALRMAHLSDTLAECALDIIAFQEVRYDSTLGGSDADKGGAGHNGRRYSDGLATARDWYNRTRAFARHERYAQRNEKKWAAISRSDGYKSYAGDHPWEGPVDTLLAPGQGSAPSVDDVFDLSRHLNLQPGAPRSNLYAKPRRDVDGPRFDALFSALEATPHAQITHLSAMLPGWYHAYQPAQLYLDPASYAGEPSRDEEGPAIFSRHPIVHSDYVLLSRDTADGGDGHQRLCLHAVVDVTDHVTAPTAGDAAAAGASQTAGDRVLVDVYSVHLALSEAARNRTVRELLAFMRRSARGQLQLLAGDMNAEPHEPAMRFLVRGMAALSRARAGLDVDGGGEGALDDEVELTYAHQTDSGASSSSLLVEGEVRADSRPSHEQVREVEFATHPLTTPGALQQQHGASAATPLLHDVWLARHPEPVPRDEDPGVRRYGFTFPSDDPVKRIDLLLAGTPDGRPTCEGAEGEASEGAQRHAASGHQQQRMCIRVHRAFVAGQDPLPGTEGNEGRRMGMTSEWSPIYASDHRALVAHISLQHLQPAAVQP